MSILKLQAPTKDYLWGGNRLVTEFNKKSAGDVTAESWELSCFPGSESVIENGEYAGKTITEYIESAGKKVLGTNCERFEDFPVLIKFIDARNNLSLQVHPSDEYARTHEGQFGKTEMWYIIDAEEGAFLYYGFNREVTKEEFARRIEDQTLTEVLNACPVKKGDVIFIESGTLHAIGAGILLAEIQQNSNVTYRVYDYGRRDKNGNLRELHVEKALDVTTLGPVPAVPDPTPHIGICKYFTVDKVVLTGETGEKASDDFAGKQSVVSSDGSAGRHTGVVGENSFLHVLVIDGEGELTCGEESLSYKKGDSFFIPAGSGEYEISGSGEVLLTYES